MKWADLLPEAQPFGAGEREVTAVTADSREVGPGCLFFALRGTHNDGHDYIADAIARGATGVVTERTPAVPGDVPAVAAPEARRLLGEAAARLCDRPSAYLPVIGITGTNGKTTVAWLVAGLFDDGAVVGTLGWGRPAALCANGGTTPGAVALQERLARLRRDGVTGVALEVSSHALDQQRLGGTSLAGAVWTNLTPEHLDYHGDLTAYSAAKARLLSWPGLGFAVLNAEDPEVIAHAADVAPGTPLWRFGEDSGEVHAMEVTCAHDGIRLRAATPQGPVTV
ncbi:MAG TPA: Mur ligase family protein, partial [Gammaproteobacteria bacterium]|nr:Mur ligase family protein [Gammaproteobacteria bacterium]